MKNLALNKFFLILACLATFIACSKEENKNETVYVDVDNYLKDNYVFQEGSFWVYESSNSLVDSVSFFHSESGYTKACPFNCERLQFIKTTFKSSLKDTFNHYLIDSKIKFNGGGFHGELGQLIFHKELSQGNGLTGLYLVEELDSLIITDRAFYQVKHFRLYADQQCLVYSGPFFKYDHEFFYAPSVGIIKYIIHDTVQGSQTWNLKNYLVIK